MRCSFTCADGQGAATTSCAAWWRSSTSRNDLRLPARHVPRARATWWTSSRRTRRTAHPRRVLRRLRSSAIYEIEPAHRRGLAAAAQSGHLPGQPLRHQQGQPGARLGKHRGGARGAPGRAARRRQAARSAAPRAAHPLRPGAAARHSAPARGSKTTPATSTAAAPASPRPPCSTYFPKDYLLFIDESHIAIPQLRRHVPRRPLAQGDARRVRLPPALGAGQPAAHVRGVLRSGSTR
ncbi:MAG: hypothetical protein KatS3mg131_2253 [Candidatus Tectimicrobiota bacterium]|nr:MAG: hypothetical protein KatS3mg131_2253 [Candidatus Tectomicrobia bacterium]